MAKGQEKVCKTLSHELLHAYDDCRAKLNLKNMEHLACVEVNIILLINQKGEHYK